MSEHKHAPRIYVSGETVPPGVYRDLESGTLVAVYEHDELPANTKIVRSPRLFYRVEEAADMAEQSGEAVMAASR